MTNKRKRTAPVGKGRMTIDVSQDIIDAYKIKAVMEGVKPSELFTRWVEETMKDELRVVRSRQQRSKTS